MDELTRIEEVYADKSIVDIVVESLQEMTSGLTESIRDAFNGLVLNENGTGLSMLAIWTLTFLGVGFIWKVLPMAIRFFKRHR